MLVTYIEDFQQVIRKENEENSKNRKNRNKSS